MHQRLNRIMDRIASVASLRGLGCQRWGVDAEKDGGGDAILGGLALARSGFLSGRGCCRLYMLDGSAGHW